MIDLEYPRPTVTEIEALARFSSSTVHEAIGQSGAMSSLVKPIASGMKACGPALTVDCPVGDNLTIHAAIAQARAGDLLVVDFKGFLEAGPFGEIMAHACRQKGIVGLVIDGCVRDSVEIQTMNFPLFARGLCIRGTSKLRLGSVGRPITCAGVSVSPGDIVLGDDDGVVVVPRSRWLLSLAGSHSRAPDSRSTGRRNSRPDSPSRSRRSPWDGRSTI
jgi:4-hydroxy-4-methyl-2-oxoglutarate aldolase